MTKRLAIAFATALLLAGCGGSSGGTGGAVTGEGSSNTSVCTYTKAVSSGGRVYVEMSVSPKSREQAGCDAFNGRFGGREIPTSGKMGTGHVYCRWNRFESSSRTELGVFASGRRVGRAFCRSFDPGPGFKPYP